MNVTLIGPITPTGFNGDKGSCWHDRHVEYIHTYAKNNDISGIQRELDKGVNVNIEDPFRETPLHYASRAKSVESINFLISKGANVNARSMYGFWPLSLACYANHYQSMLTLLNNGAVIDFRMDALGGTMLSVIKDEECRYLLSYYNDPPEIKEPDV